MSKQFNLKDFLRKSPNVLLEKYFYSKGILRNFDFKSMTETKIQPLYEAWLELENDARKGIEKDFQEINFLSTEGGIRAILDEAGFHKENLAETLAALDSFHAKSFWTFLNRRNYWQAALLFNHADNVLRKSWRKRKNIPHVQAEVGDAALRSLEKSIGSYFYKNEARGKNCHVEVYRRNNLDYFFCYPEDYSQAFIEWEHGDFARKAHHPAFEIIFVYCQEGGTLDIYYSGGRKIIPSLQHIFAQCILGIVLDAELTEDRVYDLSLFKNRNFEFVFSPDSGIESIAIRKMRLLNFSGPGKKITLEVSQKYSKDAIYDLLDEITPSFESKSYNINMVGIKATVRTEPNSEKTKTVSFSVTYPNSCSLKHEGVDLILRQMLSDSGVEPTRM